MSRVSIYLNFMGKTEEAFNFYKQAFKTEFTSPMQRMRDVQADANSKPLPDNEKDMIMHVALPILGGTVLMGTDMLESMGHTLELGNNVSINLEPDTKEETQRLFKLLSEDGTDIMPLAMMFWGDYFGTCVDRFGARWMFNFSEKKS